MHDVDSRKACDNILHAPYTGIRSGRNRLKHLECIFQVLVVNGMFHARLTQLLQ
ncbi:MAG: hypothetical protein JWO52_5954 [Gammaproteobacteria bacterium]|nr:hypothetical protein [Gammaproteobacteria bacterium]